jgi:hypothetical protein
MTGSEIFFMIASRLAENEVDGGLQVVAALTARGNNGKPCHVLPESRELNASLDGSLPDVSDTPVAGIEVRANPLPRRFRQTPHEGAV